MWCPRVLELTMLINTYDPTEHQCHDFRKCQTVPLTLIATVIVSPVGLETDSLPLLGGVFSSCLSCCWTISTDGVQLWLLEKLQLQVNVILTDLSRTQRQVSGARSVDMADDVFYVRPEPLTLIWRSLNTSVSGLNKHPSHRITFLRRATGPESFKDSRSLSYQTLPVVTAPSSQMSKLMNKYPVKGR